MPSNYGYYASRARATYDDEEAQILASIERDSVDTDEEVVSMQQMAAAGEGFQRAQELLAQQQKVCFVLIESCLNNGN